jgi:hypothetical protein
MLLLVSCLRGLEKEIHSQSNAESGMGDVMLDNRIYGRNSEQDSPARREE